jgi:hypothetical protein
MAMIDAPEAAQKIAAANVGIRQAKMARPSPGQEAKVKMAERRLAVLLRVYKSFKDDPEFIAAYRREMSALGAEVEPSIDSEAERPVVGAEAPRQVTSLSAEAVPTISAP